MRVHDVIIKELGRAVPCGVYDIAANAGWVSVGIEHATAAFAVQTIRIWWKSVGAPRYPDAKRLTITADEGGSDGGEAAAMADACACGNANFRVYQMNLASPSPSTTCRRAPANETRSSTVCSPSSACPGAKPLVSYQAIIDLISGTTTEKGLTVRCELDSNTDTTGIVVSDEEMDLVNIARDEFHGEWNDPTQPRYDGIGVVHSGQTLSQSPPGSMRE